MTVDLVLKPDDDRPDESDTRYVHVYGGAIVPKGFRPRIDIRKHRDGGNLVVIGGLPLRPLGAPGLALTDWEKAWIAQAKGSVPTFADDEPGREYPLLDPFEEEQPK